MGELPSIRLEHASLLTHDQIDKINKARMRFGVVSHTIFLFAEYENYVNNLSAAQFQRAYPIRTYYENMLHPHCRQIGRPQLGLTLTTSSRRSRREFFARPTTVLTSGKRRRSPYPRRSCSTPDELGHWRRSIGWV